MKKLIVILIVAIMMFLLCCCKEAEELTPTTTKHVSTTEMGAVNEGIKQLIQTREFYEADEETQRKLLVDYLLEVSKRGVEGFNYSLLYEDSISSKNNHIKVQYRQTESMFMFVFSDDKIIQLLYPDYQSWISESDNYTVYYIYDIKNDQSNASTS